MQSPELTIVISQPHDPATADTALSRAQAGDLNAFEELVARHERLVLRVAMRLVGRDDARDIAQEAFLRLYHNLKKLGRDVALNAWLYRVTVNLCRDRMRKGSPAAELDDTMAAASPSPETLSDLEQRKRILAEGLRTLGEKERAAVVMRDIEGLDNREIARILGSSETTVRSQVCLARMKLRSFAERFLRRRI